MPAPTGYNPPAKTLLKQTSYETLEQVPQEEAPAADNVFGPTRPGMLGGGLPPTGPGEFVVTIPAGGSSGTPVIRPSWGGPPVVIGNPPPGSSYP